MSQRLIDQLDVARRELLDLTARNRLLNTPLARGRSTRLDVVDELSGEVFRVLVQGRKDMNFLPSASPVEEEAETTDEEDAEDSSAPGGETTSAHHLAQPDEELPKGTLAERHTDRSLQTRLADDKLQTRLLRLYYDARTMFEEQGVNSLFLALGFLEWYESPTSDKVRYAPLLLLPVELHRREVNSRFRVKYLDEEITTNLSLQAKMRADFGLQIPDLPDIEDLDPVEYFSEVERVIGEMPRWHVHRDRMTLWFFSFSKFLMFRDLAPDVWPEGKGPTDHPLVAGLLGEPVSFEPPLIREDEALDQRLQPQEICHVLDADSSQAAAVEEVRSGRNLVIQGPPGTGKSQSIANVIAAAVREGRTVLFVAEKLAALEVVKSRLDRVGLGDMCLELHSHKANRRAVLDDLDRTLNLGKPKTADIAGNISELARVRDRLNRYVNQLHSPLEDGEQSPYGLIGTLCRLRADGIKALDCQLPELSNWSRTTLKERQALLRDVNEHLQEIGDLGQQVWRGVRRKTPLLPSDLQSVSQRLTSLCERIARIIEHATALAKHLNIAWDQDSESFQSVQRLAQFAGKLRDLPAMDRSAFGNDIWSQSPDTISRVVERG
ncbi:MAG: DUF4011 domain-containing protein, partial [Planctomycetaceae bacterium]|nr:DUF4011 domain-containing protein [Planctomycetaceae bacterium]